MAFPDPRFRIKDIIDAITVTIDDGATPASILYIYEGGPEVIKNLFLTQDYDIVVTVAVPRRQASGPEREIQDAPLRYTGRHPVTTTAIDKEGVTATKVLFKMKVALDALIPANAQQIGYTVKINSDGPKNVRAWGTERVWVTEYIIEYKPTLT